MTAAPIAGYRHITRKPGISGGEPIIAGSRITVRHIVDMTEAGEAVEDILEAIPHLTPAQIHGALAYYFDHQEEIDALREAARPERVFAALGMEAHKIGDGIAVIRKPKPSPE